MDVHQLQEFKYSISAISEKVCFRIPSVSPPVLHYSITLILIHSQWFSCLAHFVCFGTNYFQASSLQAIQALPYPLHISTLQFPLSSPTFQNFVPEINSTSIITNRTKV